MALLVDATMDPMQSPVPIAPNGNLFVMPYLGELSLGIGFTFKHAAALTVLLP